MRKRLAILLVVALTSTTEAVGKTRRNVLFLVVDDMRPDLGAYNASMAHTPNMDRLAQQGLTFKRSYIQYAFCAPSRNSFMSGRRPDTTRVWNFYNHFREKGVGASWASLPGYFRHHGYNTLGSGKLFHPGVPPEDDYKKSWSHQWPYFQTEHEGRFKCIDPEPRPEDLPAQKQPTYCPANVSKDESRPEYQLIDQRIRDSCISQLRIAKAAGAPFFVGCGFHKPHVKWVVPQEFFLFFPENVDDIPLARNRYAPQGMVPYAWHYPADVHGINIPFNGTCNLTRARLFRKAYYAAVAYTDYNIGKVVDELDNLGLTSDTIVIVFGDHGWHLGDQDTWAKMTNFEIAVRIPTIIRVPWMPASIGKVTNILAEAVDFYPTLAELAGLPHPMEVGEHINGTSLISVFTDPHDTSAKTAAFSQFAKNSIENPFEFWPTPTREKTQVMGYSVRVDHWRYTAWFAFDGKRITPRTDWVLGRELYSHVGDDGDADFAGETVNVVDRPEHARLVKSLHQKVLDYISLVPVAESSEQEDSIVV